MTGLWQRLNKYCTLNVVGENEIKAQITDCMLMKHQLSECTNKQIN
jgi:hypothetical protein